ncbi:MAG: hypothetical protein HFI93_07540 [Lachnospiraceae bacterium]|nr:hypothetical protein [Lachnospiraceae bacterium]
MADYKTNLEKYKRMQNRVVEPEYDPLPVNRDRLLGKPMMFVMIILAILFIVTIIGGGYEGIDQYLTASSMAAFSLFMTYYGYRLHQLTTFYKASRRFLKAPGSIRIKQLAANTRYTEKDTLSHVKGMIRRKYYRNLTLSEDGNSVQIARIQSEEKTAGQKNLPPS